MSKVLDAGFQRRFDPSNLLVKASVFPLNPLIGILAKPPTCFAKGTKISMADGSEKEIETLRPATPSDPAGGDVLISVDGVKTYVVGMLAGPRPEPCLKIQARSVSPDFTDKKFKVIVSMGHTISVDLSRMVIAWFLREGDYISTTYGRAIISKIDISDYDDEVWNVYLASKYFIDHVLPNLDSERLFYHLANSSLGLTPKQHLIFGNGILSGDLYVQIHSAELARLGYSLKSYV